MLEIFPQGKGDIAACTCVQTQRPALPAEDVYQREKFAAFVLERTCTTTIARTCIAAVSTSTAGVSESPAGREEMSDAQLVRAVTEDQFLHCKQPDKGWRLWCSLCQSQVVIYKRNALARASIERSWIRHHQCEPLRESQQNQGGEGR